MTMDNYDYDNEEIYENELEECPKCGRPYNEIDSDYLICSKYGWDVNTNSIHIDSICQPSDMDYLNGDADILIQEFY